MNTAMDWFLENIEDIRGLFTPCEKCDGEGEHACGNCHNMTIPYCPNCLEDIADGQGNCPKCYALKVYGCDSCAHTGYVPCKKCDDKGYVVGGYELDGKQAKTIDELWRKFNKAVTQ